MRALIRPFVVVTTLILTATAPARGFSVPARGYFISIDGLQPKLLENWVNSPNANPTGFQSIWKSGAVYPATKAHVISITAASHAGTATCSSPARHGITGNHFLQGGKRVSGFKVPFQAETMWESARREGKKVASFAYAGVDGTSPARTTDIGITYPDESRMGNPQLVNIAPGDQKPTEVRVTLNPATRKELLIQFVQRGQRTFIRYQADHAASKEVEAPVIIKGAGAERVANILVHDSERLRRIVIRAIPGKPNTWLVSRASYNEAFPESYRKQLDDAGLVWPDINIKGLNLELDPSSAVAVQGLLDDFIAEVASRTIRDANPDIVLFYQPLIDSTGHGFQSKLPDASRLDRDDPVSAAYRAAFKRVDNNIAKVLATAGQNDVIALMGDHGMTATRTNLNVAPVLPPNIADEVEVYASDSMLYLYPKAGLQNAASLSRAGEAVRDALAKVAFQGQPVIEMIAERATFKQGTWPYGEAVWAFRSLDGIWFNNNPLEKETFLPAKVPGMHGHNPDSPSMLTAMMFKSPGLKPSIQREKGVSLVQAVPTFARLLNLKTPKDCEGTPVF